MNAIIAALDFSDASGKLLAQTRELAAVSRAEVHLVHVIEDLENLFSIYAYTVPDALGFERRAVESAQEQLAEFRNDLGPSIEKVVIKVLHGSPADAVLKYAEEVEDGMLVIGKHGHGAGARVMVGSVVEKILRHASMPVLLVPVLD